MTSCLSFRADSKFDDLQVEKVVTKGGGCFDHYSDWSVDLGNEHA